jgi:transcriptional regulator of nitric oxide reductase
MNSELDLQTDLIDVFINNYKHKKHKNKSIVFNNTQPKIKPISKITTKLLTKNKNTRSKKKEI